MADKVAVVVGAGPGLGQGPNFVDEDGDGVCDNCGAGQRMDRGHGKGWRFNQ